MNENKDNSGNVRILKVVLPDVNDFEESAASGEEVLVAFDLETTSLEIDTTEICQISAAQNVNETFDRYIVPRCDISEGASSVTGLTVKNGKLYLYDNEVETVTIEEALEDFVSFLERIGDNKKVILVAHNGFRFDYPIIIRHLYRYDGLLKRFIRQVPIVADSLPALREHLPDRVKEGKSFALTALVEEYVGSEAAVNAHNAVIDVKNLLTIIDKFKLSPLLRNLAETIKSFINVREDQYYW